MRKYSMSVKACVKRGARWLDENFPGWTKRIDIHTLRMHNPRGCICGQVFAEKAEKAYMKAREEEGRYIPLNGLSYEENGFSYAKRHLFAEANSWLTPIVPKSLANRSCRVAEVLGFECQTGSSYNELEAEWVKLLAERAKK